MSREARIAQGERLIYNNSLDTKLGRKLFWEMQELDEMLLNIKLIELINTIYKAPKEDANEEGEAQ